MAAINPKRSQRNYQTEDISLSDISSVVSHFYPELNISGYTSVDGTVEFYGRLNSIIDESKTVLDFGAGRAAWFEDDPCHYRRSLRNIRERAGKVVGCDIDDAIFQNNSVDEQVKINLGERLPFEDHSFDVIVSDYTFEHIANPSEVADEFHRILRPGGWICARTPNKYSYISVLTRLIKNTHHAGVLKYAQTKRKEIDVFPTTFLLNSKGDVSKYFDSSRYKDYTYRYEAEPAYYFNSKWVFAPFRTRPEFYLPGVGPQQSLQRSSEC